MYMHLIQLRAIKIDSKLYWQAERNEFKCLPAQYR